MKLKYYMFVFFFFSNNPFFHLSPVAGRLLNLLSSLEHDEGRALARGSAQVQVQGRILQGKP